MSESTNLLLTPAPGTVIKPIYEYDDQQEEKLQALREVCPSSCTLKELSHSMSPSVCILASSLGHGFICAVGAPMARQVGHAPALPACFQVET